MSVSTLHKLDKLTFPSSVEFTAITSQRVLAGITSMIERPAGHVHPMYRANMEQKPSIEFSTPQLNTLLGAIGVGGTGYTSAITAYFKAATTTGNVARATTGHRRIVINEACAYWTSIRLPHNGKGEANVVIVASWDGTNDPFVYTGSVALSGTLAATPTFGAGPVAINGTALPGVKEIDIQSGVRLIQEGGESEVWDTFVGIEVTEPVVTIRALENVNWATLGLEGTALDGEDGLVFYARKFAANGSRVAAATEEHIKFVGLAGSALPVDTSGDGSRPTIDTIRCELVASSDSVAPLTGTVNSAIT